MFPPVCMCILTVNKPLALVYDWNSTSAEPPSTCTINHPPAPMRCYVTLQSFTDTGVALPKMEPVNLGSWATGVDSSFARGGGALARGDVASRL